MALGAWCDVCVLLTSVERATCVDTAWGVEVESVDEEGVAIGAMVPVDGVSAIVVTTREMSMDGGFKLPPPPPGKDATATEAVAKVDASDENRIVSVFVCVAKEEERR